MSNFKQKDKEIGADKQVQKQAEKQQVVVYKCQNCGGTHSAADKFCSECGMGLKGNSCLHCGAATHPNHEICLACGHYLQAELCSFCGEKMAPGDAFCSGCGNPRAGIVCSDCSTLNFRSFCRKCNAPLNALAYEALEEARKDPKVQKVAAIALELEELEQFLREETEEAQEKTETPQEETETPRIEEPVIETPKPEPKPKKKFSINIADKETPKQELKPEKKFSINITNKEAPKQELKPEKKFSINIDNIENKEAPKPESTPQNKFSINIMSKEEAMQKYREKLDEMNAMLASMLPDAGMTPQMQRNYYSARKVQILTITKIKVPLHWICNAYNCIHPCPEECVEPWRGGKWIYTEREETSLAWGYK